MFLVVVTLFHHFLLFFFNTLSDHLVGVGAQAKIKSEKVENSPALSADREYVRQKEEQEEEEEKKKRLRV